MSSTKQHSGVRGQGSGIRADHGSRAAAEPAQKPRGWLGRNWRRVLLAVVLLPVLAATAAYFHMFGPLIFSKPYSLAIVELRQNPQVTAALGQPIQTDWIPRPSGEVRSEDGEARLMFPINGANGLKANVSLQARLIDGKWGFSAFDVSPEGGKSFSIIDEINGREPSDTPAFVPGAQTAKAPTVTQANPDQDVKIEIPDLPAPDGK